LVSSWADDQAESGDLKSFPVAARSSSLVLV
jgi:hypothetical protein